MAVICIVMFQVHGTSLQGVVSVDLGMCFFFGITMFSHENQNWFWIWILKTEDVMLGNGISEYLMSNR